MNLFVELGLDMGYVIIGVAAFSLFLLLLNFVLFIKLGKLSKKYKKFMLGADGKSLEIQFVERFIEIDALKAENMRTKVMIDKVSKNLSVTYQKIGMVKYNAFKEMGGKLSFALSLLNDKNDGFIINSMHSSREGCYTYIKEIIKGEAFVVLAEEEKVALEEAKKCND